MAIFIKTRYTPKQLREELQRQKALKTKQLENLHERRTGVLNAWANKLRNALQDDVIPFLAEVSASATPEKLLQTRGRREGGITSLCALSRVFALPDVPGASELRDVKHEIKHIDERIKSLQNCDEKQVFLLTASSYKGFTQGAYQG